MNSVSGCGFSSFRIDWEGHGNQNSNSHIPKRKRPMRDCAGEAIPLCNPTKREKEAALILKNAVVIRNPYGPTAYSLVGRLIGLNSDEENEK